MTNTSPSTRPTIPDVDRGAAAQRGLLVRPSAKHRLFPGWGPILMSLSLGTLSLAFVAAPGNAATDDTPRAACIIAPEPPTLVNSQSMDWPVSLADTSATGVVLVKIDLDEHAHVRNTEVDKTSGDFALDQEARRLARHARFTLTGGTCTPPASYDIEYDFVGSD